MAVGNGGYILQSDSGAIRLRDPRMTSEGFEFWIDSLPGRSYTIEASTDTVNWASLGTQLYPPVSQFFRDRDAHAYSNRFYRVVSR